MKKLSKGGLVLLMLLLSAVSWAQNKTITGKVLDESNEPLSGAAVTVKNSTVGASTNANGEFTLSVPASAKILVVSYVGYVSKEITISGNTVSVSLVKAISGLDEVVVVGYGTQKKSVVTGAIASVRARDLENVPNGRIEQALQGRASGVTIMQNSGQPGSASTIRVRGVTTFNNNNPLWVVDGVVVDAGGIGYLNQSDIESIEVLKDASAAIYGTRAAAGVILVTTKKGKSGKLSVSYNGFYGTSAPARLLELTNAAQYATLINERSVAGGGAIIHADPASLGVGTDWQKAIFNNNATRYLHEVSLSGGNERSTFFMSAGIQKQNGIVTTEISKYEKKNFRLASTHKIGSMVTFGQTIGYTYQKSTGLGNTNSEFGGPLSSAVNLDPITPVIVTDAVAAAAPIYANNPAAIRDGNGNPYGISLLVGQEMTNPIAYIQTRLGGYNWSDDFVGNAYLEVEPVKGLKFRTSVGIKRAFWGNIGFTPVFFLSPTVLRAQNSYTKGENRTFSWNVENTVTYSRRFGGHNLTVLAGQGAYSENIGGAAGMTYLDLPVTKYQDASFNFDLPLLNKQGYASDMTLHNISSLFARLNYSYEDRYLLTAIVRQDGSTRFGPNKKYATFPSFSAGWNIDRESFWPSNNKVVNTLKLRGGYGTTGNDASADFRYLSTVGGGYNYAIGNSGTVTTGYAPLTLDNPDLVWEKTASTDLGFDAQLFNNVNLTVNWFSKKTTGILRSLVIPGYVGVAGAPWGNLADMTNAGVEIELGYRKRVGDLNISINTNLSFLKNTVNYVAKDTNFIGGDASFQSMGAITRTKVGESYNSFWGYQRLGIFQTQADIDNYKNKAGTPIQPNARPGDFMWADNNGDGVITADDKDKVFLGNNIPKYTFGFTINLEYKGFDLMAFAQGAGGNKIFQGLRRLDIQTANFTTRALGRWTGPGTSTDYPRLVSNDPNNNVAWMSDFYLEDGDYLRLKVVQLGYTLPTKLLGKSGISKLRLYITAENLLTLTKYTGYDPEVGGGVFGIDRGQYPQARTFIGGLQLQF